MTAAALEMIAHQWFDAFNQHDLEKLLSLYDEHARHYSPKLKIRMPETQGWIKGKPALREWWQDAFHRLPNLHYKLHRLTPYENRMFMEYTRMVPGEPEMIVGELLEIENDRIVQSTVFHT